MIVSRRDARIKGAVLRALRMDPRVNDTEIGVAVTDGVVTLTGRVDSEREKAAVQEAAHRAAGVLDVANDVVVRVPFALGRTDADLAQAVRDAFERQAGVPADCIHSSVYDALVTLTGTVDTARESEAAEHAAHRVAGVRRVENKLVVRTHRIDVDALRRAIDHALERRAHREAGHIALSVRDGVVRIDGSVHSDSDRSVVLELVRHAPAVQDVEDRLRVEP